MTRSEVIALGADEEELALITEYLNYWNAGGQGEVRKYGTKEKDGWLE